MTRPTNPEIADLIGVHFTAVSRWRSGSREPTYMSMLLIAEALKWPVGEQASARVRGVYAEEFERHAAEIDFRTLASDNR
jgi:transcriptional regulator with XRE-family HTH domain